MQTPMLVVRRMLQIADVSAKDVVWDLGSGDGRIVIAAALKGARGVGFEIDPNLIRESKRNSGEAGVSARTQFIEKDLFTLDFSGASVVTMYLLPEFNLKLRPQLLKELKPGSRVVSHEWDMGDWQPDETLVVPSPAKPHGTSKVHKVFLWVIPATIAGRWRVTLPKREPLEVEITQQFQQITIVSNAAEIAWAALRGREFSFALREGARSIPHEGQVSVDGKKMVGKVWSAIRIDQ